MSKVKINVFLETFLKTILKEKNQQVGLASYQDGGDIYKFLRYSMDKKNNRLL